MTERPTSFLDHVVDTFSRFKAIILEDVKSGGEGVHITEFLELLGILERSIVETHVVDSGENEFRYSWIQNMSVIADNADALADWIETHPNYRRISLKAEFDLGSFNYLPLAIGTPVVDVVRAIAIVTETAASTSAALAYPTSDKAFEKPRRTKAKETAYMGLLGGELHRQRLPYPHRQVAVLLAAIERSLGDTITPGYALDLLAPLIEETAEALRNVNDADYAQTLHLLASLATKTSTEPNQKHTFESTSLRRYTWTERTVAGGFAAIAEHATRAAAMLPQASQTIVLEDTDALSSANLNRIVELAPEQQVAPVQFKFVGAKLAVLRRPATLEPEDKALITSVRKAVVKAGDHLLSELTQSQCDRRFLERMRGLHAEVLENEDIVYLGMQVQQAQIAAKAHEDEFSSHYAGLLAAYFGALLDYVAQFPEWQRFLERSVTAHILEANLIDDLRAVLGNLSAAVAVPDAVEPEVAEKLHWLGTLIVEGQEITKKSVMAVALSLQNLASALVKWGIVLAKMTANKTQDYLSTAAALTVVSGIAAAMWRFVTVSNLIARYPWLEQGLQWLEKAGSLLK